MANNYSLIGTRPSTGNPGVTEYYNTQSGVGFSNPESLSNFFNQQYGGSTNQSNIFSTLSTPSGSPTTIQPNQLGNSQALNLPQPANSPVLADSAIAGSTETSNQLKGYLEKLTYPAQPVDTKSNALMDKLSELYGQNTGRANATLEAEQAVGLDVFKKQLADINAQLLTKTASANAMQSAYGLTSANLENPDNQQQRGIPMNAIIGQQAQVSKMALAQRTADAAELSFLQARALGIQGQVQAAQEAVNRAVDLRFQAIEEEITAKEKQLQLIQPLLDREQTKIANAQNLMLQDQKTALEEQKAQQKNAVTFAIQNNIETPFYTIAGTVYRTSDGKAYSTPDEFFADGGARDFSNAPIISENSNQKLLTVAEAQKLGVPYGTTQEQASQLGIVPTTKKASSSSSRSTGSSSSGTNSTTTSTSKGGSLTPFPKTASANNLRNWLASNWHAKASQMSYYDVWGMAADEMRRNGIDPSTKANDKLLWDVFRPGEYEAYHKNNSSGTSSDDI